MRNLLALREQIQQQLDNNPPPPSPPSYDDMRRDILGAQSHVLVKFLKTTKLKDGTTLMDKAEGYARKEFAAHQRRESGGMPSLYVGPRYENWRDRTLEHQRRTDRAAFENRVADMNRRHDGPDYMR
ncbi:hypothetical protein HER39_19775 [Arthrobacter deserti]|uniref:Uncharacterized protein n=1 Tax=Arthrobacter deserti TaxID=1742687 RepID=A0ABX1JVF0_9MICC|nr:hypothetical protein [Arthrobacter deserti]